MAALSPSLKSAAVFRSTRRSIEHGIWIGVRLSSLRIPRKAENSESPGGKGQALGEPGRHANQGRSPLDGPLAGVQALDHPPRRSARGYRSHDSHIIVTLAAPLSYAPVDTWLGSRGGGPFHRDFTCPCPAILIAPPGTQCSWMAPQQHHAPRVCSASDRILRRIESPHLEWR